MRKLFTFLLALVAGIGLCWAQTTTVTWYSLDFTELGTITTNDGIQLSEPDAFFVHEREWGYERVIDLRFHGTAAAFSTTYSDWVFTKIEVSGGWHDDEEPYFEGDGWNDSGDGRVWTGQAATVPFDLYMLTDDAGNSPWTIVFTLAPAGPATYTLRILADPEKGSVALQNPSSDIVDNGNGYYTVPENAEVTILATPLEGYEFSGWRVGSYQDMCYYDYCGGDALNTNDNPLTVTMTADVAYVADFAAAASTPATPQPVAVDGKLPGAFSVASNKKVCFSQGNLRATTADNGTTWTWAFAADQLTFVGNATANTAINGNGTVSANGTVDLFGWSTATTKYGIHNSRSNSIYSGDFVDWGSNPDLIASLGEGWRTLTSAEWTYLLNTRTTTSGVRYAKATVDDKTGLIILPDDWSESYHALASANTDNAAYTSNTFDAAIWSSDFEAHGAVFLPAAGYRLGTSVEHVGVHGNYWSASPDGASYAWYLAFNESSLLPAYNYNRVTGEAVRLVSDIAPVTNPTVKVKGSWDNWADAIELTDNGDGTASANVAINGGEGYYTFKFVTKEGEASEAWLSDNAAYKRNYTGKANLSETETDPMNLWIDAKGTYTFTWTYETNAFTITFPALPTVQMKGSWDDWNTPLNFTDNGDGTASLTKTFSAEGYYTFKTNIGTDDWRGNGYTFKRDYTGANWINDNGSDMILYVDQTGDYTFTWTYLTNAIAISFPTLENRSVSTNEDPNNAGVYYSTFYHSSNKYALTNDGTEAFVATLSEDKLSLTKIAEGTDVLPANTAVILRKSGSAEPVVLTPSNEEPVPFEAVNSLMGRDAQTPLAELGLTRTTCYVLSGTAEYGVGFYRINSDNLKAHKAYVVLAGLQNNAPHRLRFVFNEEKVATGVESIQPSAVSSQKVLRDGQLVIIRNGVEYNAAGQMVK